MAKNRTRKIPEKIQPQRPAMENDTAAPKADRRRPARPGRISGFVWENDPSPITWFLD